MIIDALTDIRSSLLAARRRPEPPPLEWRVVKYAFTQGGLMPLLLQLDDVGRIGRWARHEASCDLVEDALGDAGEALIQTGRVKVGGDNDPLAFLLAVVESGIRRTYAEYSP